MPGIVRPPVAEVFADTAVGSPDIAVPTYMSTGFPAPSGTPVKPPRGYINWLFNWTMQAGRYLLSRGIAEWASTEDKYQPGSVVFNNDFHYWALMNGGVATTGTSPDADTTNWSRLNVRDRPNIVDYNKESGVWRNYKGQRRNGFDYWGFLNGNVVSWDDQWDEPELQTVTSTGTTTSRRWLFRTDGSGVLGGILSSNNPQYVTAVEGSRLLAITSIPNGGAVDIQLRSNMYTAVFNDDITAGMFWSFMLPPTANANCTFVMGFNAGGTRVGSITNGAYLYKSPSDTNWQFVAISGGVSSAAVDTGVVAASGTVHRAALVLAGANQVDSGGVAKAVVVIDGNAVGTPITTHLPYTTGGAGAGLPLSPVFGIVTTATASATELRIGPVRYRQNVFAGDVGVV